MLTHGTVLYLNRPLEAITATLQQQSSSRPLLTQRPPQQSLEEHIAALHRSRQPIYRQATHTIDTESRNCEAVADQIIELLSTLSIENE